MTKTGLVRCKGSQNCLVSTVILTNGVRSCAFAASHAVDVTGFCTGPSTTVLIAAVASLRSPLS